MNSKNNNEINAISSASARDMAFDGGEVNLYDLVSPLLVQWRTLVLTSAVGLLAGLLGWWFVGYHVELKAVPVSPLNFIEWRKISSGLPALAEERRKRTDGDPLKIRLYDTFAQTDWWSKNVGPQYRLSKSDLKELGAISKDSQESGAMAIETVVFHATNKDTGEAIQLIRGAEEFVREGGLLLALKSLLVSYDLREMNISAELRAKASKETLELGYLNKRANGLEALIHKYPEKSGASMQTVLDPKDNSSKYLPLTTQLMAVKTEIRAIEESLERSRDQLEGAQVFRTFLDKTLPLLKIEINGLDLSGQINAIAADIRRGIDPANKPKAVVIDQIIHEFSSIGDRYKTLFEDNTPVSTKRSNKALPVFLGLTGGLLCGVLLVFVRTARRRAAKEHRSLGNAPEKVSLCV